MSLLKELCANESAGVNTLLAHNPSPIGLLVPGHGTLRPPKDHSSCHAFNESLPPEEKKVVTT